MQFRNATAADITLLAELNAQLADDEAHPRQWSLPELVTLWRGWLRQDYTAILFEQDREVVAYALFRPDETGIFLRQFFVCRGHRRQGIGRRAMRLLRHEIWPPGARVTAEVLVQNDRARRFWKALGFIDHAVTVVYKGQPADQDQTNREGR